MSNTKKNQYVTLYLIAQKHEEYGYTSLETLAEWNRKLPKKNQSPFTCKKITKINSTKYHS
jgi:hypothetical protein